MLASRATILLFFYFLIGSKAFSQLYIGPVAGPQISMVSLFDRSLRDDYRPVPGVGFQAGGMVSMMVKKKFYFTGSLVYSQKQKIVQGKLDPKYKNKTNLRYLEMPLYYTLEFTNKGGKFAGKGGKAVVYDWFLGGGPVVSYWLGGKGRLRTSYLLENEIQELPYTIVFRSGDDQSNPEADANTLIVTQPNRFQFSLNITGGVSFQPMGYQKIITAVHLEFGQTFLSKENTVSIPASFVDLDPMKAKNHNFRISVAYVIDTKVSERNKGKSTVKEKRKK